jgi:murein L,D-transpeptidase YcbB/YkuD
MKNLFLLAFAMLLILSGCSRCSEQKQTELVSKPEDVNKHVQNHLKDILSKADSASQIKVGSEKLLAPGLTGAIYKKKDYMPLWIDAGELTPVGDTLLRLITDAGDYGLIPSDYKYEMIDSLLAGRRDSTSKKYDAVKLYKADMLLTDAFFVMSVHLGKGRLLPDTTVADWRESKADSNIVDLLEQALAKNLVRPVLESMEPKQPEYHFLKLAMKKLREEFKGENDWDTLPPIENDTASFYKLLKPRLIASHDYDSTLQLSDSLKLAEAIRSFQKKHALEPDGKPGKNTRRELNLTLNDHIRQIAVNMERWRLEPKQFAERYVWVNIPAYKMRVMEADTMVMESRIVSGDPKTPTPLLTSSINYILIYPYWNVPYSIAWKEMLPKIQRDTSYLRKNRFEVLDRNGIVIDPKTVSWKKYSKNNLPFKFRQREGEDNSLGVMKFNFNNKHGVYMHDTNAKRYFSRDVRALSHGCMRLEKYMDLANFIIRDDSVHYRPDSLVHYLEMKERKQINLRKPLKIYVKYYTCEADSNGNIMFYTDIYRKDEQMIKVLYRNEKALKKKLPKPEAVLARKE